MALCGPLNADFDGDTISVILVPEEAKEDTYNKMSPRTSKIYKKNLKNIFEFNHEALNGLANLSEYTPTDPDDLKNPKYYYTDYKQLLKDVEVNHVIDYGTPIVFTGTVGGVNYQSKITTYGRLRISKILQADMDEIRLAGEKIFKNPTDRISAKTAAKLTSYLYGFEDGIEKARDLRQIAYKCVTKTGVVTFDYSTLYVDTDNDTYKEMRKIADSTDLTDKQKLMMLTEKYAQYEKEIEGEFSSDLKKELDRAARVKLSSIVAINMPQFIISSVDEIPILTRGNLLEGYSEEEYQAHAIENRSLQSIKQSGVNSIQKGCACTKSYRYCWKNRKMCIM